MQVLIIGGTSFIGPHVVRRLHSAGHDVTVYHRGLHEPDLPAEVQHIHHADASLGDRSHVYEMRNRLRNVQPDVVLDMTAMTAQDAWTLVHTFSGYAGRAVVISSLDVYRAYNGLRNLEAGPPDRIPLSEDGPLRRLLFPYRENEPQDTDATARPRWLDDYDKILVELVSSGAPDLPATHVRLPAVYGPNDGQHRLYTYLRRMDDQRPAIILSEAQAAWRWTRGYVENVAAAIALAVTYTNAAGKVYNVGEQDPLAEAAWVAAIGEQAGWQGEIKTLPETQLPDHMRQGYDWSHHIVADTQKIRVELGYEEPVAPDEALQRTIAWERQNPPPNVDPSQFDYTTEDELLAG